MSQPPTERITNNTEEQHDAHVREAEQARKRDEFMKKLSSNPRFRESEERGDAVIIVGYPKPKV